MKRVVIVAGCLAACCAAFGALAGSAAAGLPELGRCVEVGKTGQYLGAKCVGRSATHKGRFEFVPGPGEKKKFTFTTEQIVMQGTGAAKLNISCEFAEGEGEYTGAKTLTVGKLVVSDCKTPKKSESEPVLKTWCQNVGNFRGEVTAQELAGEIGYITAPKSVGLDLKAKNGNTIALFECGGASESPVERGTGTGTLTEIEGSVIGAIKKINVMTTENVLTYKVSGTKQVPEMFEGGEKDTLITNIGIAKTAEPTTLKTISELANEEPLEIKAK